MSSSGHGHGMEMPADWPRQQQHCGGAEDPPPQQQQQVAGPAPGDFQQFQVQPGPGQHPQQVAGLPSAGAGAGPGPGPGRGPAAPGWHHPHHQHQPPGPGPGPGPGSAHQQHHHLQFAPLYTSNFYNTPVDQLGFPPEAAQAQLQLHPQYQAHPPRQISAPAPQFDAILSPVTQAPSTSTTLQHQHTHADDARQYTKQEPRSPPRTLTNVPPAVARSGHTHRRQTPSVDNTTQRVSRRNSSQASMHTQGSAISPQQYETAPISGSIVPGPARKSPKGDTSPKASKKRAREDADSSEQGKDEEQRKKLKPTRGRPRLTTTDESPVERRRAQIRMAQRAYRDRKDQAITDLEEKVKKLEEERRDMSKALSSFLDFLYAQNAVQADPEVARRSREIWQKFLSIAGPSSQEGDEQSVASSAGGRQNASVHPRQQRQAIGTASNASSDNYTALPSAARDGPSIQGPTNSFASSATSFYPPETLSYEVIAQPTPENASFPSYTPDSQGRWVEQPPISSQPPGQTLVPVMSAPTSLAPQELTFSRRLQRTTLERGLMLATMPNPPPERFGAFFGFCLLFESRETIVQRLNESLHALSQDSMNNWRLPFTPLGGPSSSAPASQPESVGDIRLDKRMRMEYGLEGEFLDPDEVDVYLQRRNISIPGNANFVEVELNPNDLGGTNATEVTPVTAASVGPSAAQAPGSGMNQPAGSGMWQPQNPQPAGAAATGNSITPMFTDGTATGAVDAGAFNPFLYPAIPMGMWTSKDPPRFKATLDVTVLIEELVGKSVCLGQTPGIRPKDVDRAVKIATGLVRGT